MSSIVQKFIINFLNTEKEKEQFKYKLNQFLKRNILVNQITHNL